MILKPCLSVVTKTNGGREGIHAAWFWTAPLFSFPTTSLLCCLSVCSSLCPSAASRGLFAFFQHIHIHDGSRSLHVETCVCVRVCVLDIIGLWSEGILHSESQVEREQGPHCSEHYAFSIVSLLPPSCAWGGSCGGGTRRLFIRINSARIRLISDNVILRTADREKYILPWFFL